MGVNDGFYDYHQGVVQSSAYRDLGSNLLRETASRLVSPLRNLPVDPDQQAKIWPACVNLALSCEISLKLLLWTETGKMARGHGLDQDLYQKLSEGRRDSIRDRVINRMRPLGSAMADYSPDRFEDDLTASDRTFSNERYIYEVVTGRGHQVRPAFLDVFSGVLLDESRGSDRA